LQRKTVVDTTNPIANAPPVDGVVQFFTGPNDSLMERLQAAQPDTNFVKAFSSVGHSRMVNPQFSDGTLWCIPGFLQNKWTHAFKVVWK
jgi:hypothetical protein